MAATHTVTMNDDFFDPQSITIPVHDSILWINRGGDDHTTTSDSPGWDSGVVHPGGSFMHQFDTPGTFPYHCEIHAAVMKGTVVVTP
ncbi:cupredoxin domain-containing protein [Streptomyces sp. UNOC14_S4]|uniref:cupredoxin domain-containing protein n=1 Tax=Streptomyces sp. UNOC14_S4 TaxID=2872340 RepID=UPI001E49D576|nr:cupredoxin domain-containing protein [Streptomyces sp. UNOC14_S4]MCC3771521.1 cupredoxin domain-containing protein [Streptomyces sp. UNOC14_S4]